MTQHFSEARNFAGLGSIPGRGVPCLDNPNENVYTYLGLVFHFEKKTETLKNMFD
jgi:hypothetical protein